MTVTRYLIWIGATILWFAVICAVQYPIRKRSLIPLRVILIIVKLFLAIVVAYTVMAIDTGLVYHTCFYLAAFYVALFADAVGDIFTLPLVIKKRKTKSNHNRIQIIVCAVCSVIYLVFGTVNMQTVSANRFSVTSDKLSQTHRCVFVSDLHVGSSQSMDTTKATIRKIDEEDADFVVLGGDIVDEYSTKEEMQEVFSLIGKIRAEVYFIYGNHDRQPTGAFIGGRTFTDEELESAILSNGIQIIKDEWVPISDDLVLLGREDATREDRLSCGEIPKRPDNAFVLCADHSPFETEDIIESGADLQISGHSHAGQLFPLRGIFDLAGYDAYGFYRHGDTDLYISSGASGWCFPFRTEAGCHYEVITLEPTEG